MLSRSEVHKMGITDLNSILNEVPHTMKVSLTDFRGKRIAIDASMWMYANISICQKEYITKMPDPLQPIDREAIINTCKGILVKFISRFCKYGITLVFVWDGKPFPEKEIYRKLKRSKDKERQLDKISELRVKLESSHPLARLPSEIKAYKDALCRHVQITAQEIKMMRLFIENAGIPSIISPNEAEKLCSALAQEGIVMGVWSTDTDNYIFGAPLIILGFDGYHEGIECVKISLLGYILHGLSLTHEQLVDLAIMLECDFNKRMTRIGPKTILPLIKEHKSIEKIMEVQPHWPWDMLNHIRCREIFRYEPSNIDGTTLYIKGGEIDYPELKNALQCVMKPSNCEFK